MIAPGVIYGFGRVDREKPEAWAAAGINCRTPHKRDRTVRELTGGGGVDLIVEVEGAV
jgi:hypothetical protein